MMENTQQKNRYPSFPSEAGMTKRLARLALAIFAIVFFMLYLGPEMQESRYFKPMVRFIEERNIDASALYYTEIEEFSVAEVTMTNTMKYMPRRDEN